MAKASQKPLWIFIFFVIFIISLMVVNHKISSEISEMKTVNEMDLDIKVQKKKVSKVKKKTSSTPRLVNVAQEKEPSSQQTSKEPKKEAPKIIYELPLDDVVLVQ